MRIASAAGVMVVSVNYRLAPEHRLPAAYDDCAASLAWLRSRGSEEEEWLRCHSDLSRIFLVGDSAGGIIVHHVALREAEPTGFRGLVMVQQSFAGEERSASEAEQPWALRYSDKFREMSLPLGTTRDHEYCNPLVRVDLLEKATLPPPLVVVGGKAIKKDREREYCEVLKAQGKDVRAIEFEEEDHAFYALLPHRHTTQLLVQEIALFLKLIQ